MPVSVTVTNRDGVWMVDPHAASPEDDEKHILLWLVRALPVPHRRLRSLAFASRARCWRSS